MRVQQRRRRGRPRLLAVPRRAPDPRPLVAPSADARARRGTRVERRLRALRIHPVVGERRRHVAAAAAHPCPSGRRRGRPRVRMGSHPARRTRGHPRQRLHLRCRSERRPSPFHAAADRRAITPRLVRLSTAGEHGPR